MSTDMLMQPTCQLRYFAPNTEHPHGYWRYDWWDDVISFNSGRAATRTKRYNAMAGVLAGLLADSARTLTAGQAEEHGAESS